MQRCVEFTVPAMRLAVKSRGKVKRDALGCTIHDERIIPKGRPRLGRLRNGKSVTFTPESTIKFEKHIREYFFKAYYPKYGVITKGNKTLGVHEEFLGCQIYGAKEPCSEYRQGHDFEACKGCKHRRKNLSVSIEAFLKDDRHIDADNILKIVLDAMEHVCFYNDTQFNNKRIQMIPYASTERLEIEFFVDDESMCEGSLISGYDFSNLSVKDAEKYARELISCMDVSVEIPNFVNYLRRRDKRKYVEGL